MKCGKILNEIFDWMPDLYQLRVIAAVSAVVITEMLFIAAVIFAVWRLLWVN